MKKRTLRKEFSLNGIGLHSGRKTGLRFIPSDHGKITFLRNSTPIDAHFSNVSSTNFAVTLSSGNASISTVEHLLAALHAMGVDSLYIEVDGPEIPVFDGSSRVFFEMIESVGTVPIDSEREYFKVKEPVQVSMGDKYILFLPSDRFEVKYTISFNHPLLDKITESFTITPDTFRSVIGFSRTFTFLSVVNELKSKGLIKGGSFDNAIVLDDNGIVNGELRIENEWLKHKVLDLIGDIYLIGKPFIGKMVVYKGGHTLDVRAARHITAYQEPVSEMSIGRPSYGYVPHFDK
ncbi:UDP-3-O-[3-hydroxymyristoyl] N-acetylglucosamine deacetylase [bacterium]|nr:UDP-3-O-[3-hydroxymyristoyl] N-acetylglucosamine deacetylase [bacterium]